MGLFDKLRAVKDRVISTVPMTMKPRSIPYYQQLPFGIRAFVTTQIRATQPHYVWQTHPDDHAWSSCSKPHLIEQA